MKPNAEIIAGHIYVVTPLDGKEDPKEVPQQEFYLVEAMSALHENYKLILDGKIINIKNPRYKYFSEEYYHWELADKFIAQIIVDHKRATGQLIQTFSP